MDDRRLLQSDDGAERTHVAKIADEFFEGFEAVSGIAKPAVTIFGSARVPEGDPQYELARAVARKLGEAGLAVGNPQVWGMALKISDGSERAVRPVGLAALDHMGVEVGAGDSIVRGLHGEEVGEIVPLIWARSNSGSI